MKPSVAALAFPLLAACGMPDAVSLLALEESEHRFAPLRPGEPSSRAEEILRKEEWSLDDVLEIAAARNPQLAIERRNVDLATAALWEARLYPNPSLTLDIEDYPTGGDSFGDAKRTVGLSIPVVLGGRIGAASDAAGKERDAGAIRYVWRRREILTGVKRAFVELLAARRHEDLARESRDIARRLHSATEERFQAQAVPEMELLKAAVTLAKSEADLRLAGKNAASALRALHAFLGLLDLPHEKFIGSLHPRFAISGPETLRDAALAQHPLLEEAVRSREAAEFRLVQARSERLPDLALEIRTGRGDDGETLLEAGLSLPLPVFHNHPARILDAEIRLRQAELRLEAARTDLLLRIEEGHRTFVAAQDRVSLYEEEILPKARKALEQTNAGYEAGKFGQLDLLDAQRTLTEANSAHVAALADLNLAAAELEMLTGTTLNPIR